ncbi:MAG: exodeoxyribonuclease III [Methanobacteriaceae archaeon]
MTVDIVSWNVNGIRAIHKKGFLDWISENKSSNGINMDILCIQEIKAQVDQLPKKLVNIPDFKGYFNPAERKGYSGVATYSSLDVNDCSKGFGIEKFDIEGRVLRLDFDDFILFNVYFPNGGSNTTRLNYKLDFYNEFLDHINDLRDAGNNLVICGDVNTAHKPIDIARPKENEKVSGFMPIEREWIDKLLDNGYVDTFRMFNNEPKNYTWWSYRTKARDRNVGWRLDYFFVNEEFKDKVIDSYILGDVMGSDHCPIGIKLDI